MTTIPEVQSEMARCLELIHKEESSNGVTELSIALKIAYAGYASLIQRLR